MSTVNPHARSKEFDRAFETIARIKYAIGETVVGQDELRSRLIGALITDGHILLEGVPGLAKTLSIKALAEAIDARFQRIQFTPDLLPADLIGTEVFKPQDGTFEVRKGPVFANLILADEINRAPAKVQSALLETMQEKQVTIGEKTLRVPTPFFVMATQNPIEQEGTYPLPEAQIDRFIMKVRVDYPSPEIERQMLDLVTQESFQTDVRPPVATLEDILQIKKLLHTIYVDQRIRNYIVDLAWATRTPANYGLKMDRLIELGASPRASIALFLMARAEALFSGMTYVTPQNVKDVAMDVLRHRVMPTYEAEAQGLNSDALVSMILEGVQVP
ncbi:MAG: MoxR family ATPase [Deltaproteobacteria bacterium]|nr:MoxR family ATPase [Deltaproteobacteria bacterium]